MVNSFTSEQAPIKPTIIRYALIGSLLSLVITLVGHLTGIDTNPDWMIRTSLLVLTLILFILVFRSAVLSYRDQENDGSISFGKGFKITFWITVIVSLISSIFLFILLKYMDSAIIDFSLEQAILSMEENGMDEDQIEKNLNLTSKVYTPSGFAFFGLIVNLFFGCIIALFLSLIYKREAPAKFN